VCTNRRTEMVDITGQIQELVRLSRVEEGVCHIFQAHTTAGLTINENADPSVAADILMVLNRIISDQEAYRHLEGNSPAHIKACLMGPQLTVLVSNGSLLLGAWQGVFLCEFDGPRTRKVHIKIMAG
ncbi:MAG: secondary thiamine-phosphate synthase enzyme YjbQ, partial [Deltaproteobacteria bacterium]|nr:secondary thiamine-phosphate synthase enzyme YjbQ [Deltaproteobacteria bacterium]